MTTVRSRLRIAAGLMAVLFGLSTSAAFAATDPDASVLGSPLSALERDQAQRFCAATIAQAGLFVGDATKTCGCFPSAWETHSNRLHRLALGIALAPESHDAKEAVWTIGRLQGGIHENLLEALSTAFQAAVRRSIATCKR